MRNKYTSTSNDLCTAFCCLPYMFFCPSADIFTPIAAILIHITLILTCGSSGFSSCGTNSGVASMASVGGST